MIKVVLDTNVFISALLNPGKARNILYLARNNQINIFISTNIFEELSRILREKFHWPNWRVRNAIIKVKKISTLIFPISNISLIVKHKADNRILECALEARVNYIISGDKKHILLLKEFKGIKIMSPAEFLEIFLTKAGN